MADPGPASGARGPAGSGPTGDASSAPGPQADSPAEARGRRILSTAFVNLGPDGHLMVELGSGRTLVLRDVVLRARDYCGTQIGGDPAGARYCGGYGEVAAARPGGPPASGESAPAVLDPAGPARKASGQE